jgi:hypothetical protein
MEPFYVPQGRSKFLDRYYSSGSTFTLRVFSWGANNWEGLDFFRESSVEAGVSVYSCEELAQAILHSCEPHFADLRDAFPGCAVSERFQRSLRESIAQASLDASRWQNRLFVLWYSRASDRVFASCGEEA